MKKSKVLITGGAGFIGSNLCGAFLDAGHEVICFDNLLTGRKSNVAEFLNHPNFTFFEEDILNQAACEQVMQGVDFVSHQAALGSVPRSIDNPIRTSEINTQGFLNVLTAAKNAQVKRFVYASSSSVYGDSLKSPKKEEELGSPLSPYAVSKLTNELYGKLFYQLYGIETIGLRYFNVFGPNQDENGVYAAAIPKFIDRILNNQSPIVYGDGEQTRDFTYIANVVHANLKAFSTTNEKAFGRVMNVGCGGAYSLNKVIQAIKEGLAKAGVNRDDVETDFQPNKIGDIKNSLAAIERVKEYLGYEVQVSFEKGIADYVQTIVNKI